MPGNCTCARPPTVTANSVIAHEKLYRPFPKGDKPDHVEVASEVKRLVRRAPRGKGRHQVTQKRLTFLFMALRYNVQWNIHRRKLRSPAVQNARFLLRRPRRPKPEDAAIRIEQALARETGARESLENTEHDMPTPYAMLGLKQQRQTRSSAAQNSAPPRNHGLTT